MSGEHQADERTDDELLAALAELAAGADPAPVELRDAARAVFTWRTIDAELAELAYDSESDDDRLVGVRGAPGDVRRLTFVGPELTVELQVAVDAPRRVTGQLVPPQPARIEFRRLNETIEVHADEVGRFRLPSLEPGALSLRCERRDIGPDSDAPLETEWIFV